MKVGLIALLLSAPILCVAAFVYWPVTLVVVTVGAAAFAADRIGLRR